MVKKYSLKKDGNTKVSENFLVKEFASPESDVVLIDTQIVSLLEQARAKFKGSVIINSAYRSPAYNRKVGGISTSAHVAGRAVDFKIKKDGKYISAKSICIWLEEYKDWEDKGCVGYINGQSVHVDNRDKGIKIDETSKVGGRWKRVYTTWRRYWDIKSGYSIKTVATDTAKVVDENGKFIKDKKKGDKVKVYATIGSKCLVYTTEKGIKWYMSKDSFM